MPPTEGEWELGHVAGVYLLVTVMKFTTETDIILLRFESGSVNLVNDRLTQ